MKRFIFAVVALALATSCLITDKTTTIYGSITAWYDASQATEEMTEDEGDAYYYTAGQFFTYKNIEEAEADTEDIVDRLLRMVYPGFVEAQADLQEFDVHQKLLKTLRYTFTYNEEEKSYDVESEIIDSNGENE